MKYLMYFLVAIPWAIALFVVFIMTSFCVSVECYRYVGFDLMIFSIISILFTSGALWAQFFIMSFFRLWLPFKIKNDGNAKMVHFGWFTIPMVIFGGGFAYILFSMWRLEGEPTFSYIALFLVGVLLVLIYKFPNIYIKNEFDGTSQRLKYYAITFKGLVSKSVPFSSIKEIKTYKDEVIQRERVEDAEPVEALFSRRSKYNKWYYKRVFLLHTVEIIYETEEAEDKNLILVRGRDLDGEETVKQIETFIADSLAKGAQKSL